MSPVYRVRSNYPDLRLKTSSGWSNKMYRPDGTLWQTTGVSGFFPGENLVLSRIQKDEIHFVRKGGPASGRFPPGYCAHAQVDLSKATRFVDGPYVDRGVIYTCRVRNAQGDGASPILMPPVSAWHAWLSDDYSPIPEYGWNANFRPPQYLIDPLSEEAWNYFSEVLPEHLSFGEFVQGITQLKELIPEIGESITKTVSGGYLNKKFGWDNLLRDLETLSGVFESVFRRMDYFRRTYGIPTRLGFSRPIEWWKPFITESEISVAHKTRVELISVRTTFRATAWIIQELEYMTDLVGFLRILAGEFGLNNPVKLFWQTLPLSFVVDWFFRISLHLDNLTRLNPPVGWFVYDATQSVSSELVFQVSQVMRQAPTGTNPVVASYLAPAKYYERLPNLTFRWDLLNPSGLSETQLTLLLAMLHQYA